MLQPSHNLCNELSEGDCTEAHYIYFQLNIIIVLASPFVTGNTEISNDLLIQLYLLPVAKLP